MRGSLRPPLPPSYHTGPPLSDALTAAPAKVQDEGKYAEEDEDEDEDVDEDDGYGLGGEAKSGK